MRPPSRRTMQVWAGRQHLTLLFLWPPGRLAPEPYSRDLEQIQPSASAMSRLDYDVANRLACFDALMRRNDLAQGEFPGDARLKHTSLQ